LAQKIIGEMMELFAQKIIGEMMELFFTCYLERRKISWTFFKWRLFQYFRKVWKNI